MPKLFDAHPSRVEYLGKEYPFNASFDRILEAFSMYKAPEYTPAQKLDYVTFLLLGDNAPRDPGLVNAVFKVLTDGETGGDGQKTFDFEQDADAIFASFLQVYGINLRAMRGKMHWLDFAAAMKGLFQGPKCPLSELVYIRSCPIPKPNRTNQEQIRALMKAKAKCRLKLSEEEERQQYQKGLQKMAANLMGGVRHG